MGIGVISRADAMACTVAGHVEQFDPLVAPAWGC
jgi:hypothetical protein